MKTNTIENKINESMRTRDISQFDPLIRKINQNLRGAGIREGSIIMAEGRVEYCFPYPYSGRSLYVSFNPEKINYDSLNIEKVNKVISPNRLYCGTHPLITMENTNLEDIPKEIREEFSEKNYRRIKDMDLTVEGYTNEEGGPFYIASFLTDGKKIVSPNHITTLPEGHPKYQTKLNETKNPLEGIDLMFEILTN